MKIHFKSFGTFRNKQNNNFYFIDDIRTCYTLKIFVLSNIKKERIMKLSSKTIQTKRSRKREKGKGNTEEIV